MNEKAIIQALEQLEKEKGISKDEVLNTIELALHAAYKKNYGDDQNAKVEMDRETGEIKISTKKKVVKEPTDPKTEISLKDARKNIKKTLNENDEVYVKEECNLFRRNAIQNAKQIVIQKIRETERNNLYYKLKENEHEIINGIIRRIDQRGNIYIEFQGIEALLPTTEQSPNDVYRIGDRLKIYIEEIKKAKKYPKVIISRKSPGLLEELFKFEIPEITEGLIEIKSVVREAGSRSKIAVYSDDENIDTIGACIGQKGIRIKTIVEELNGENIDIIEWEKDQAKFIKNALSPAKVTEVRLDKKGKEAKVIVPKNQLSLAIGKSGQNARLAAKLTGTKIDIKTIKEIKGDKE
ncbi:MAG: transcription termination factor NusA [Fusobacteriota bacterium]